MERIKKILEGERYFILATHVNPDADGLSSVLAMTLALKNQGKVALPLVEEAPPAFLDFLHGFRELRIPEDLHQENLPLREAVAMVFDLSEEHRLGKVAEVVKETKERVILDHHALAGKSLPGVRLIDPKASATALLVLRVLESLNWPISAEVAENLYAGLYSDTGGFRFENTGEDTFLAAARLVRLGARPAFVGEKLLENYPPARFELLKRVLARREILAGGKAVLSYLTLSDFEEVGARPTEAEDFATFLRSMRGVELSALIKEIRPGEIGVSLRSRGTINVAELAFQEGGGGHLRAAGFKKNGFTVEEVVALVRSKILVVLGG
ncbi:DHH family phosphoesterase [Thermosulfurimonas dismutans]|uniref:Uncharacterized protein n=1 Tax=Thermosulfurimonas dismutans TaxID=999894 RepID=A0A179D3W2_9BACT|nr:bifunctional oligoribonuclease/PAP phosphatase NrnA [Thermosulfurimonas dismutans]OAQ20491.1 hypothetical protein TDIS_1400 [Thermosulfurimonas dismutans]